MKRSTIPAALAAGFAALSLSSCYIVPVGPEEIAKMHLFMQQQQANQAPNGGPPLAANPAPKVAAQGATAAPASPQPTVPTSIQARLYPLNEIATENGMVSGTVTNMMNGKGRLQVSYRGELLTGEATRVANDERKGVASAWGQNGSFMTCEYQMSSPLRGAGTCSFSDGARYQVHVGN
jgi:hypothetical protein